MRRWLLALDVAWSMLYEIVVIFAVMASLLAAVAVAATYDLWLLIAVAIVCAVICSAAYYEFKQRYATRLAHRRWQHNGEPHT